MLFHPECEKAFQALALQPQGRCQVVDIANQQQWSGAGSLACSGDGTTTDNRLLLCEPCAIQHGRCQWCAGPLPL